MDLTQGVKATIVYQVLTANAVKAQCEAYEYTSKNFAYALGLSGETVVNGANIDAPQPFLLTTPIVGSSTTPVVSLSFGNNQASYLTIPQGAWMYVQDPVNMDHVHYFALAANSTSAGTSVTVSLDPDTAFILGDNFPAGAIVGFVNSMPVGDKSTQPFHAMKVTSTMPEGNVPVTLFFPKVRITRGFSVTFGETAFGNMPLQFTPFELLPTDPFYAKFQGHGYGKLMSAA